MAKCMSLRLAGLALLLGSASGAQKQLQSEQHPLSEHTPLADDRVISKPVVDSETLQAAISADNLLTRAKKLYEIAKLSEEEYNHPTRVIGSDGR
jgi:aminopeptidase Y